MSHLKEFEHLKIPLEAIKSATNNFSDESCIGKGGFGKVYKGEILLSGGKTMVALKRLDRSFGQGDPEFWKEIIMLSHYKHENIVSLLGYCDDSGEKILMYEYASKKSLDLYLNSAELTWVGRLKICIASARGVACLHSAVGMQQRVLHRDIKSSNILLDENWNAKISDFGLSKFGPANQKITFLVSHAVGTLGYCDPLYAETGLLTKESDVYSFGVLLFEVLCGRLCLDINNKHMSLVGLARQSYKHNTLSEIVFENIKDGITPGSLKSFTSIAYQCLKRDREKRPPMTQIVKALETALLYQELTEDQVANMYLQPKTLEVPILDTAKGMKQPIGILNVKVLRAMHLKRKSLLTATNPYVKLRLTNDDVPFKNTTVRYKTLNPEWNEEFNLIVKDLDVQALEIVVCHDEWLRDYHVMGMYVVTLKDIISKEPKVLCLDILKNMDTNDPQNEKNRGQIVVEMMYKPLVDD